MNTQKKSPSRRFFYSCFLWAKPLYDALRPSTFIVFGLPSQLGLQFNTSRRVICAKNPLFSALKTSFELKYLSGLEPHLCSCYMQIVWEQIFDLKPSPFHYDLEQKGVQASNFSTVPALALKPAPSGADMMAAFAQARPYLVCSEQASDSTCPAHYDKTVPPQFYLI